MQHKNRTYIIAEAGVNHNGSIELAKKLIDIAVDANADAVKFQTFKSENVVSSKSPKAEYQKRNTPSDESQLEMIKSFELTKEEHIELFQYCKINNIDFLSSPFDEESIVLLIDELKLPIIKIASGEITNAPLLLDISSRNTPVILSTGMCTLADIESALGVLALGYTSHNLSPSLENFRQCYCSEAGQRALKNNVTLLHCTTAYPTPFSSANLNTLNTLKVAFGLKTGYSDHTLGIEISLAAVALGASIIEKHFTLTRTLKGPDHSASLEPDELKSMINKIRNIEQAMGKGIKAPVDDELVNSDVARKSLIASKAIKKGELFTKDNLTIKRPGSGISPYSYWEYLGKRAKTNYDMDDLI
ncbi:N-acetylneuraminate synthase [Dongshaea marina]|uniref:N-acetylneuraminate synthase n=1 Tax=Dongshaea marina TaxID=2047966 RepID=UPI000D3E0C29|nr:N-acetylneuraminate synthase [Dongshaea marina]